MKKRLFVFAVTLCMSCSLSGCASGEVSVPDQAATDEKTETVENTDQAQAQVQPTEEVIEEEQVKRLEPITAVDLLSDVELKEDNIYTCSYDGIDHDFILEFPKDTQNAPLLVMLHGYGGSASGFRTDIGIENIANEKGYAVVYVTGAPNAKDATSANGWNSGIGDSDNKDAEFLVSLVQYLENEYGLDKEKTYVAGFSNGAFMVHRLALQTGDTFEAFISVAGMMPESMWEARPISDISVSFLQVTGQKDDVVPKNSDGSADHSKAPAIESVIEYYVEMDGLDKVEEEEIGKKSKLTKYSSSSSPEGKKVWDVFIPDGRHSWPNTDITGIDMNQLIIDFIEAQ